MAGNSFTKGGDHLGPDVGNALAVVELADILAPFRVPLDQNVTSGLDARNEQAVVPGTWTDLQHRTAAEGGGQQPQGLIERLSPIEMRP